MLLEAELNSGDLIFELNNAYFLNRTESAVAYLAEIAQKSEEKVMRFFNTSKTTIWRVGCTSKCGIRSSRFSFARMTYWQIK